MYNEMIRDSAKLPDKISGSAKSKCAREDYFSRIDDTILALLPASFIAA
jgi:hypothetical protein